MSGTVEALTMDWRGDTLAADVADTDAVLVVGDTIDFDDDDTAQRWLVIADSTTPLEYVAVDEDAGTVTLADVAGAVFEAGDPVTIWDPSVPPFGAKVVEYLASVMTDRGSVDAVIPHTLIPSAGVDNLVGASVTLAEGEDWYVEQVLGREPVMDLSSADPNTIPDAHITAPRTAPAVVDAYDTVQFTDDGLWGDRHGWSTDGTYWYTARLTGGDLRVEKWTTAGALSAASGVLAGAVGDCAGVAVIGSVVWVLSYSTSWVAQPRNTSTLNAVAGTGAWAQADGTSTPALGADTATGELLIAQTRPSDPTIPNRVRIRRYTTGTDPLTAGASVDTDFAYSGDLAGVTYGAHDFGGNRYVLAKDNATDYQVTSATGALVAAESWQSGMAAKVGFAFTGGAFVSMDKTGLMRTYTGQDKDVPVGDPDLTRWWSSTLASALSETDQSPRAKSVAKKRSKTIVTAAAIEAHEGANVPDRVRFYVGKGAVDPGPLGMVKQPDPAVGVVTATYSTLLDPPGTPPPTENGFGAVDQEPTYQSVRDHGAVGDGVIDDTAAIQNAIDAAGGGTVFFPRGTYRLTDTLAVTSSNVQILGEGWASVLSHSGAGAALQLGTKTSGAAINGLRVAHLRITGTASGTGGINAIGVQFSRFEGLRIDAYSGAGAIGLLFDTQSVGSFPASINNTIYGGFITGCYHGLKFTKDAADTGTDGCNHNSVYGMRVAQFSGIGVDNDWGENNTFYAVDSSSASDATTGFRVNDDVCGLYQVRTDNSFGPPNTAIGIRITATGRDHLIFNPTGDGANTRIQYDDTTVSGMVFRDGFHSWVGNVRRNRVAAGSDKWQARTWKNISASTIGVGEVGFFDSTCAEGEVKRHAFAAASANPLVAVESILTTASGGFAEPGSVLNLACDAGAVAVGDTMVVSTTVNGRAKADNTVTNPRNIIGTARTSKAAGANGTVKVYVR